MKICKKMSLRIIVSFLILFVFISTIASQCAVLSVEKVSEWTNMTPTTVPESRLDTVSVYNVKSDRIILFSGATIGPLVLYNDTWTYDFDNNIWTKKSPVNMPQGRSSPLMAYDEESDRTILFSGLKTGPWDWICWNDTWMYNLNNDTWEIMDPPIQPPGRCWADMVYDKDSDRIILFGGFSGDTIYDKTWTYDYNTNKWTDMNPSTHPSPRWGHRMAYEEESDRIILFGGSIGLPPNPVVLNDTWAYDYNSNTWSNMTPTTSPTGVLNHGLAYDTNSDRIILFGGWDEALVNSGDTWVYDFNTNSWVNETSTSSPSPRISVEIIYPRIT